MFDHSSRRFGDGIGLWDLSVDRKEEVGENRDPAGPVPGRRLSGVLGRSLPASYTIEMSVLVPLALAVIVLILQMVLYAHDTVWTDAWICIRNQELGWQQDNFTESLFDTEPRLTVLRQESVWQEEEKNSVTTEAVFRFCLLPEAVRVLISGIPDKVERAVTDPVADLPGWMRKMGAYLNK